MSACFIVWNFWLSEWWWRNMLIFERPKWQQKQNLMWFCCAPESLLEYIQNQLNLVASNHRSSDSFYENVNLSAKFAMPKQFAIDLSVFCSEKIGRRAGWTGTSVAERTHFWNILFERRIIQSSNDIYYSQMKIWQILPHLRKCSCIFGHFCSCDNDTRSTQGLQSRPCGRMALFGAYEELPIPTFTKSDVILSESMPVMSKFSANLQLYPKLYNHLHFDAIIVHRALCDCPQTRI